MSDTFANAQLLTEKWAPVLDHQEANPIGDNYKKNVTAMLLENQEQALRESSDAHTNNFGDGNISSFDPILISLVRRAMPNLIAYDVASVQPMSGPTGLIFSMRARYQNQSGNEALFHEPDTDFSGEVPTGHSEAGDGVAQQGRLTGSAGSSNSNTASSLTGDTTSSNASNNTDWNPDHDGRIHGGGYGGQQFSGGGDPLNANYSAGRGMTTQQSEHLGTSVGPAFNEMAFTIDKATVTARSRALKAEYTTELAQDLKAVHGLDAESELANILSAEVLGEINREVIRTIYLTAVRGAQDVGSIDYTSAGTYDLVNDSDGRWSMEKFKGLVMQIEFEANKIALETRRGKGNILICNSNVASALHMAGMLDYSGKDLGIQANDPTGDLFVGTLNGRIKVYVDPFATADYACVGYKGENPYDAGMFYCPYVPLQMVRAVDENSFQPKIGFKTRYGLCQNPFNVSDGSTGVDLGALDSFTRNNKYYRIFAITSLHGTKVTYPTS